MCPPCPIVYEDDGVVCPGAPAGWQRRPAGPFPLVPARVRSAPQERERPQGPGRRGLPPRQVQGTLPDPREPHVQLAQSRQAPDALAEGPLRRGREATRQAARSRWSVPHFQALMTPWGC